MDIVLFSLIILFPGYLLTRYFWKKIDAFLVPPLSFALGLGLLIISAIPSYIFRLDFAASTALIGIYSVILLFLVLKKGTLFKGIEFKKDFISLLLLILVVGATLVMFRIAPHVDGDIFFHFAQIRKLTENSPVSPIEAVFPINTVSPAYGYSVWYFAIAITGFLAKIDIVSVWNNLIFVILPISLLSLFGFASAIFKDRLAGITTAAIYVFFEGIRSNALEFRVAPYPDQVARHLLLFIGLLLFINFMKSKKRRDLFLTVLVAATLATVHLYSWVHFLIAVGAFSAVGAFFLPFETVKNGLKVIGSVLLLSAPYLALKLQTAVAVVEPESAKRLLFTIYNGFYIVNPRQIDLIFYLSIAVLAYLIFKNRKSIKENIWVIFITASAVAGLLVVFNPILAPLVSKLITFTYMKRLLNLVYIEFILAAFIIFEVFRFSDKSKFTSRFKSISVAALTALIILIPANFKMDSAVTDENTINLMTYIQTNLPEKSVFASGLWLGIRIPAYTNNYIVMGDPTHITWNVDKDQRLEDTAKIFSAQTSIEDTVKLLDKYDVSYVVLNLEPKKQDVEIDVEKFANQKEFEEIYRNDGYRIYSLPEH